MIPTYSVWIEIQANKETIADPERFAAAMSRCARAGMDAVLLSVRDTSGFVLYPSGAAPHYSLYDPAFRPGVDYLAQCLDICRRQGLAVYAAMDMFVGGNRRQPHPLMPAIRFPHWQTRVYGLDEGGAPCVRPVLEAGGLSTVSSIDDFGELFLDPMEPEVQQYLLDLAGEVLENYPVQGIVLDRVRYVGLCSDFGPRTRAAVEQLAGTSEGWPQSVYRIEKGEARPGPLPGGGLRLPGGRAALRLLLSRHHRAGGGGQAGLLVQRGGRGPDGPPGGDGQRAHRRLPLPGPVPPAAAAHRPGHPHVLCQHRAVHAVRPELSGKGRLVALCPARRRAAPAGKGRPARPARPAVPGAAARLRPGLAPTGAGGDAGRRRAAPGHPLPGRPPGPALGRGGGQAVFAGRAALRGRRLPEPAAGGPGHPECRLGQLPLRGGGGGPAAERGTAHLPGAGRLQHLFRRARPPAFQAALFCPAGVRDVPRRTL